MNNVVKNEISENEEPFSLEKILKRHDLGYLFA